MKEKKKQDSPMSEQARIVIRCQEGKTVELALPAEGGRAESEGVFVELSEERTGGGRLGRIRVRIDSEPLAKPRVLAKEAPVRVFLPVKECPQAITAIYLYAPWWTRPAFLERVQDIPPRTQVVFFQYPDRRTCLVPMVGEEFKTVLTNGTERELCLEMTAGLGGQNEIDEPLYLLAEAPAAAEAVRCAFAWLAGEKGIRPRAARRIPEMFRYLGWCSWDAFKTEVTETGIRQKAAELAEKRVPVRWLLIDDGWFPSEGQRLSGFAPDRRKFPEGFRRMTEELRRPDGVRWFGVWHTLGGYWNGISPDSPLAAREAPWLRRCVNGMLVPDPGTGADFYGHWYETLSREGIDFVKVDGQSSAPFYFADGLPISEAVRGISEALERGACRMDNAIINCMGMAMENVLARPVSSISRNSDDFFPEREGSFAEHLLQNAYNAIYHNEIYCCDWDMFWTKHPDAGKHSLLRAISGGPVYFSDPVGSTLPEVLRPLVYGDGRILMMDRSAKPTEDCIFTDPMKSGVLKLHNIASWGAERKGGGIAVYNLTEARQSFSFTPADIPELEPCERYWVYDYFNRKLSTLDRDECFRGDLEKDGFAWYVLLPRSNRCACLGLLEKYVGFTAVESIQEGEDAAVVILHAAGTVGWAAETPPRTVLVNASDETDKVTRDGAFFTLPLAEEMKKTVLTLFW